MVSPVATGAETAPREINGVPLYRKSDGLPRRRFSEELRLRVLGENHTDDLDAFFGLFARRRADHIVGRPGETAKTEWKTRSKFLSRDDVVQHLIAGRLPGAGPRWVGVRSWPDTRYVMIDVDYHDDREEFKQRCKKVERILYRLGIPRKYWLVQGTPSGGRHYYFFTRRRVKIEHVLRVFDVVGLRHAPGKHEIFPSTSHAHRLPFGHVPGREHDPEAWLQFIRKYREGEIPRVNWDKCVRRAERCFLRGDYDSDDRREDLGGLRGASCSQEVATKPSKPSSGVPKHREKAVAEYLDLLSGPMTPAKIGRLLQLGIQLEGTRVAATKRAAWNFIFVRKMDSEEAANRLIEWVYRTGRQTSKDVRRDLDEGTRKVECQIRGLVAWLASRRRVKHPGAGLTFCGTELDTLVGKVGELPRDLWVSRIAFLLEFLRFAKTCGRRDSQGWVCRPDVKKVVRKWLFCKKMEYKPHIEWALDVGVLTLVARERRSRDGTGCPRTYLIHVPHGTNGDGGGMSFPEAVGYVNEKLGLVDDERLRVPSFFCHGDTYKWFAPREVQETGVWDELASGTEIESVGTVDSEENEAVSVSQDAGTEGPIPEVNRDERDEPSGHDFLIDHAVGPEEAPQAGSHGQHPWGSGGSLGQGPEKCSRLGRDAVPGVCHSPPAGELSLPSGGQDIRAAIREVLTDRAGGRPGPVRAANEPTDTAVRNIRLPGSPVAVTGVPGNRAAPTVAERILADGSAGENTRQLVTTDPAGLSAEQRLQRLRLLEDYAIHGRLRGTHSSGPLAGRSGVRPEGKRSGPAKERPP